MFPFVWIASPKWKKNCLRSILYMLYGMDRRWRGLSIQYSYNVRRQLDFIKSIERRTKIGRCHITKMSLNLKSTYGQKPIEMNDWKKEPYWFGCALPSKLLDIFISGLIIMDFSLVHSSCASNSDHFHLSILIFHHFGILKMLGLGPSCVMCSWAACIVFSLAWLLITSVNKGSK